MIPYATVTVVGRQQMGSIIYRHPILNSVIYQEMAESVWYRQRVKLRGVRCGGLGLYNVHLQEFGV